LGDFLDFGPLAQKKKVYSIIKNAIILTFYVPKEVLEVEQ
jgi:hypothetical protein